MARSREPSLLAERGIKEEAMAMRTARSVLVLALTFVVFTAVYVSAQQASPRDISSLAGKWVGWVTPTSGSQFPVEIQVQPDGSYTSMMGSRMGQGTIKSDGGKLMAEGHITGAGSAAAGAGRSELTLATKDGKHVISGAGRDDQGPYNFILTKQ
jgi:hypothetical protein